MKVTSLELVPYDQNDNNNNISNSSLLAQSQPNSSIVPPTHPIHDETSPLGFSLLSAGSSPAYRPAVGVISDDGAAGGRRTNTDYSSMSYEVSLRRQRGRPRKYGPDGSLSFAQMRAAATPYVRPPGAAPRTPRQPSSSCPAAHVSESSHPPVVEPTISSSSPAVVSPPPTYPQPPHNSSTSNITLGLDCGTPAKIDNIIVQPGEEVFSKILSFSRNAPEAISVISGIGFLSSVTLHDTANETVTYEGRFNIQHMIGLFVPMDESGTNMRKRKGSLMVALVGDDGQKVYGRAMSGLTAASLVQVMFRTSDAAGGVAGCVE